MSKKISKKAAEKVSKKAPSASSSAGSSAVKSEAAKQEAPQVQTPRKDPVASPPPAKPAGKGISWLALLFALGALGLSGFSFYQNQIAKLQSDSDVVLGVAEIGGQVSRLGDSINTLKQAQSESVSKNDLQVALMQSSQELDKQLSQVQSEQARASESLSQMVQDFQQGKSAFALDEIDHLFRLAFNALEYGQNADAAKIALEQADGLIQELDDPKYIAVRKTLTSDIEALSQIQAPDVTAISAKLNSMMLSVPQLPLLNEPESKPVPVSQDVNQAPSEALNWRTELAQIWKDIKGSVQVQRVDQPPKPLLAPEQRYFLNQNLQLVLSKAELALLQNKPQVYKQSLDSAKAWLKDYFDLKDTDVSKIMTELGELGELDLTLELPDVSASYSAFKSVRGS